MTSRELEKFGLRFDTFYFTWISEYHVLIANPRSFMNGTLISCRSRGPETTSIFGSTLQPLNRRIIGQNYVENDVVN